jgi:hypothetical protein
VEGVEGVVRVENRLGYDVDDTRQPHGTVARAV